MTKSQSLERMRQENSPNCLGPAQTGETSEVQVSQRTTFPGNVETTHEIRQNSDCLRVNALRQQISFKNKTFEVDLLLFLIKPTEFFWIKNFFDWKSSIIIQNFFDEFFIIYCYKSVIWNLRIAIISCTRMDLGLGSVFAINFHLRHLVYPPCCNPLVSHKQVKK